MDVADLYQRVSTAWTERRLENVLERQKELAALHKNIKSQSTALITAICQDLHSTETSAAAEVELALEAIKSLYNDLDFPGALNKEKSIKKGSSVSTNLCALGPTLINPAPQCPLSSTLIPLAATVAAGSAVVVLPNPSTAATDRLLRELIHKSFDYEAVSVAPDASLETQNQLSSKYFEVAVLQNLNSNEEIKQALWKVNPSIRILEPAVGLPAVFVDRSTSDLEAVAAHLRTTVVHTARKNESRVPRLCFVDEVLIEKLEDVLDRSQDLRSQATDTEKDSGSLQKLLKHTFPASFKQGGQTPLSSVVTLSNRDPITAETIRAVAKPLAANGKTILLIPVRSVDHGIDIFNKVNGRAAAQTVYIFAEAKTAFYIGNFTNAQHAFVNDIPLRSSVTVCPYSSISTYELPYRREDFSINRPIVQMVLKRPYDTAGGKVWSLGAHRLQLDKIYQPKGGRMSFFEQGLAVGLTVLLSATSTALYLSYCGVRYIQHH